MLPIWGKERHSMNHTFKLARRMARWRRESRAFPLMAVHPGSQGSRRAPTDQEIFVPVMKVNSELLQSFDCGNANLHSFRQLATKQGNRFDCGVSLLEVARARPVSQDMRRGARVGHGMASVAPEHLSSQDGAHANVF
jgi:hypothetical protein